MKNYWVYILINNGTKLTFEDTEYNFKIYSDFQQIAKYFFKFNFRNIGNMKFDHDVIIKLPMDRRVTFHTISNNTTPGHSKDIWTLSVSVVVWYSAVRSEYDTCDADRTSKGFVSSIFYIAMRVFNYLTISYIVDTVAFDIS